MFGFSRLLTMVCPAVHFKYIFMFDPTLAARDGPFHPFQKGEKRDFS